MKTKIKNIILLVSCIFIFSCGNYLDVIPDNIPTVDHAFKTRYQAEGYLYGIFSFIPNFFDGGSNPTIFGGDEVWYIDPVTEGMSTKLWYIAQGFQGTNSPLANYWASKQTNFDLNGGKTLFTALSDCNIFLENIDEPFDLDDDERDLWIAEVKFLKAFYHFYLFRMYGPIPLIKENLPIDARGEEAQRYREPVDEVVDYIVELLDEAAEGLPETILDIMADMGRPTKSIALALKAQTLVLAASPLFNGNADYASIVDNRGIQIFPQTYSVEKWTRAAVALKEAIDEAHRAGHKLYDFKVMNPSNAAALNEKTILAMQVRGAATERWNEEIIWGYSADNGTMLQRQCLPQFATNQANTAGVLKEHAATLRIVEQFYTKNGVPIEEDKDWAGIDPMELRTATADDKYYIQQNAQTIQLHFDREARFYGNITFDKSTYFGNSRITADNNMWVISMKRDDLCGGISNKYTSTGYLCKKMLHFRTSVQDNAGGYSIYRYAYPVIRLADLYLMYAEALNESKTAPDAEVYQYIDSVRARTGLKGVVESWNDYAIDAQKNKPSKKDGMREIIQRERLNELAFEGARFWDLRRWKLAEEYMNRPIRGMNIRGNTAEDFYKITELYSMRFGKKDYLWPIKQSALLNNANLVQNFGWQ